MPKRKLPAYQQWIEHLYETLPDDLYQDEYMEKLFTDERGCQAVFMAINHIMNVALDNEDERMANACCEVIDGLALARESYRE